MIGSTDYDEVVDESGASGRDLELEILDDCNICDHELDGDWDDDSDCDDVSVKKGPEVNEEGTNEIVVVKIKLLRNNQPNLQQLASGDYVMLETKIFFFMYYHVLHVLNSFMVDTFPLRNVIRNGQQYIQSLRWNPAPHFIFEGGFLANMPPGFRDWLRDRAAELGMNATQVAALNDTFNRRLSLIQGPPGTGKTYFGAGLVKIYLDLYRNKDVSGVREAPVPPFLIVCRTNHALDNFLKKVLLYTNKIVRVGGQCKSMRVTPYCLTERVCREVVRSLKRCPLHSDGHNRDRYRYSCVKHLKDHLQELHRSRQEVQSLRWQIEDDPQQAEALNEELTVCENLVQKLERDIQKFYEQLPRIFRRIPGRGMTRKAMVLNVLRNQFVIGMTTTGAAIRSDIIRNNLNISFVLVEEAAAVLESHVVVSLTQHCRCLIMLGDHKQLRPCLKNHNLEQQNFHISLFERLINIDHPVTTLDPQYRMRPEISRLLRGVPHFYGILGDGPGTEGRPVPSVVGLQRSVFFFTHNEMEHPGLRNRGYWNPYEVRALIRLAESLVADGNPTSTIAIIAMYAEQKRKLRQARDEIPALGNLKISTVDGFQGMEKDFILLSVVRSNERGNIGFVKTPNRVCVALSRARIGLFIVGDVDCLTMRYNVWNTVHQRLLQSQQNAIGMADRLFLP